MPSTTTPPLHILLLAAGQSSRMGGIDKLTQEVEGEPLLRRSARRAVATGLPVTVTLPPDRPARHAALAGLPVIPCPVPDAALGLSRSLRAGLHSLPPDVAVLMLLADLPDLTVEDLQTMARAYRETPDQILRATDAAGTPGHPVILPPWTRPDLMRLNGDNGARPILQRHVSKLRLIPLPGRHATTDLDTPEAWAAWRSGRE